MTILRNKRVLYLWIHKKFQRFSNRFAVRVCTSETIFLKLLKSTLGYSALGGLRVRGRGLEKRGVGSGRELLGKVFFFIWNYVIILTVSVVLRPCQTFSFFLFKTIYPPHLKPNGKAFARNCQTLTNQNIQGEYIQLRKQSTHLRVIRGLIWLQNSFRSVNAL